MLEVPAQVLRLLSRHTSSTPKPRLGKASSTMTAVYRIWSEQLALVEEHGADLDDSYGPGAQLVLPGNVTLFPLTAR
jgi:hypothetical protein